MTPWAVTGAMAKRSAAQLNAVVRGMGQVLGIKPIPAEMSMMSLDSSTRQRRSRKAER